MHCVLATAGHVDHGKSALVKALTGTDPDRLPEERARGITIDLGFAHFFARGGESEFSVGVVDVPGHEDFVRNMIAGVGAVDAALLVVAADDGWMPQTEEHVQILGYLGVGRGVVALTKVDVCGDVAGAAVRVRERLRGTALEGAGIVPVAAPSGLGVEELRAAIAGVLTSGPRRADIGKPRLNVDRVFSVAGVGTVVTGTLTGGVLERGQEVVVWPAGASARIRSIQSHGRDVERAGPGMRVALGLPTLKVGERGEAGAVCRGGVVTVGEGRASDAVDVVLMRSSREGAPVWRVKSGGDVWVHHGSAATRARVCLAGDAVDGAVAQLRFERPVFVDARDRVVLRDASQRWTLAGAVVVEPCAARRGFRGRAGRIAAAVAGVVDARGLVRVALVGSRWCAREGLLVQSRLSEQEIESAVEALVGSGEVVRGRGVLAERAWWEGMRARVAAAVDAVHAASPERAGMDFRELRKALEPELTGDGADALVDEMCRDGFFRTASIIRRAEHRPRLPARLREAGDRLRSALAGAGVNPPSRGQLAPDPVSEQALKFLVINGEAVEVSAQVVVGAGAYREAAGAVARYVRERGPATVSQLGAALGSPRRVMVPLLERLDREGVTRRRGDVRELAG